MEIELVLDVGAANGENPLWSADERALYWIDVKQPALHRWDPVTRRDRFWPMPSDIGTFALTGTGQAVVALRTGIMMLDLHSGALNELAAPPYDPRFFRFNDGKCDVMGRLWVGVMYEPATLEGLQSTPVPQDRAQPLHVFDLKDGLRATQARATISNGIAWSPDDRWLYFADTERGAITRYSFDADTGTISTGMLFARVPSEHGKPDGAAVDVEGGYWCALYSGSRIARFTPDGVLDREIELPVSQPTMCSFGGDDFDELFIASASKGLTTEARQREPFAGGVFRCRPGIAGARPNTFRQ